MKNKNIHILPTDKPSRLIIYSTLLNEFRLLDEPIEDWKHKKNIYITNDEEIKDGDWCIYKSGEIIQYLVKINTDNLKKIILTTDQDLIKDGVQAIDDEFLKWFVKNPSCEKVEIQDWYNMYLSCCRSKEECYCNKKRIIIPKEEPNTVFVTTEQATRIFGVKKLNKMLKNHKQEIDLSKGKLGYDPYDKQETLEEAADKYITKIGYKSDKQYYKFEGLIQFGAKWQAEQDKWKIPEFKHEGGLKKGEIYSYELIKESIGLHTNEEVLEILIKFWMWSTTHTRKEHLINWFEQFKKK